MSHKDMNFSDQVRLIQLVVGVPVTGETSNTNAQAMTALTGISGADLWDMSTEQFMDEVANRMNNDPEFQAQVLNNISSVNNPQHQALLNSFANGAGVTLTTPNAQTQQQQQTQQAPIVPPPPGTGTGTTTTTTATPDAIRLEGLLAANDPTFPPENVDGQTDAESASRVDRNRSLADNIAAQEKEARENASLSDLTRLMDGDLSQSGFVHAIQAFLSALGFNVDLTGEMDPQTTQAVDDATIFLTQRDNLIAEIAEHSSPDLSVRMASVNREAGIIITVDGHAMGFDKDVITAHGGSFNNLILNSSDALIALEASKGADATTILLDAAGLSLAEVQTAIEGAPDSAEKTAFLERINGGAAPTNVEPVTYELRTATSGNLLIILANDATGSPIEARAVINEALENPAANADDITEFLNFAANDPAVLEQAIDAITTVLGDDAAKIEAVRDAYTGGNADVTGELNEAILVAAPSNAQQPDPTAFFIPITNIAQGVFKIMGQDPTNGQDIVVTGIDPVVFSDPAAFADEISAYIDVAAQNNGVLNTTMVMLTAVTGGNSDHLKAIQSAYNGGNPMVNGAFNATIGQAETAAANTQNNALPISYSFYPDMPNRAFIITLTDGSGNTEAIELFQDEIENALDLDSAVVINAFLDTAANDPAVLEQAVDAIQGVLKDAPEKLTNLRTAYTGNNQAVREALDAIVTPASAEPTTAAPAPDAAVTSGETRRDDRRGVTTADASTIPFIEDAADAANTFIEENPTGVIAAVAAAPTILGGVIGTALDSRATRQMNTASTDHSTRVAEYSAARESQRQYDRETIAEARASQGIAAADERTRVVEANTSSSRPGIATRAYNSIIRPLDTRFRETMREARVLTANARANANDFDLSEDGDVTNRSAAERTQTLEQNGRDIDSAVERNMRPNIVRRAADVVSPTLRARTQAQLERATESAFNRAEAVHERVQSAADTARAETITSRAADRPEAINPGEAPASSGDRNFGQRNRNMIKGSIFGLAATIGGAVLLSPSLGLASTGYGDIQDISPAAYQEALNGDYERAAELMLEAKGADGGPAQGEWMGIYGGFNNADPESTKAILASIAATQVGDYDAADAFFQQSNYSPTALIGEEAMQAENGWSSAWLGLQNIGIGLGVDNIGKAWDESETLSEGILNSADVGLGVITNTVVSLGHGLLVSAAELGGGDIPPMEDLVRDWKYDGFSGVADFLWENDAEAAFKDFHRTFGSYLQENNLNDDNAPQSFVDLKNLHVQWVNAETAFENLNSQKRAWYALHDDGVDTEELERLRESANDAKELYETQHTALTETGEIMGVLAYMSAMEHSPSQPAPDATPAPSPDTAVGAFAEVAADAVEIPEVIAVEHDSGSLGLGIVSVANADAVQAYSAAWDRDPVAMADVVKTAIKEMMGGMEPTDYREYLQAVNDYYGSTMADVMRPDGEAEAVIAAVEETGAEMGFTDAAPEVSSQATGYKAGLSG